jgi:hypothetical protein
VTIDDNDLYYGAALKQIADHKLFKSINAVWEPGGKSRCVYRINTDIGVYIRAATKPANGEFVFNFTPENIGQVKKLEKVCRKVFVALVCYHARTVAGGSRMAQYRQICVLRPSEIDALVEARGTPGVQHNILVTVPESKSMRVAVTVPGRKNRRTQLRRKVPRSAFPRVIFE